MAADYEAEWGARFGTAADLSGDLPDIPWLRQVLLRRTHRRYLPRPVPADLLRLLLGAAFSASSKSDFQQASVIRVTDRETARPARRTDPGYAVDRHGAGVFGVLRRCAAA